MSVSAETYIVISLMFAVFAAVAAVGTSVVLGAGFERLRAGFEIVRKQSGFFADAIHRLDMRTQKIGEETEKLKTGFSGLGDRVERAEKTATFLVDSMTSLEHRILQGTPSQPIQNEIPAKPRMIYTLPRKTATKVVEQRDMPPLSSLSMPAAPPSLDADIPDRGLMKPEAPHESEGFTTLLSRYFTGETSGNGLQTVYH